MLSPFLCKKDRRAGQINKTALVLEQLPTRGACSRIAAERLQCLSALVPYFRDAVVGFGRSPERPQLVGQRAQIGVRLHVACDAQNGSVLLDERSVNLAPVSAELGMRELRQALETVDNLETWGRAHDDAPRKGRR